MADDEIERLLREIDAANSTAAGRPPAEVAKPAGKEVEAANSGSGRLAFSLVAAVAMGVGAFGVGAFLWFVPLINPSALDMGFGGAIAGFFTALIAGPPRWFSN